MLVAACEWATFETGIQSLYLILTDVDMGTHDRTWLNIWTGNEGKDVLSKVRYGKQDFLKHT